jgi:hypothetical protein
MNAVIVAAIARGWCSPKNQMKPMDIDLVLAIEKEISKLFDERVTTAPPPNYPSDIVEQEKPLPSRYGACPDCHAPVLSRERRPYGNDTCANGHVYPSSKSITLY